MILVDTSVWVDHLRRGRTDLARLLDRGAVLTHAFIIGELACGTIRNRREVLGLLATLPRAPLAEHEQVLELLELRRLIGRGLGWVDMHLIASALLAGATLWSLDNSLALTALAVGKRFTP